VKIVVGHGTPNAGILQTLRCCTALIAGYTSAYAMKSHPTSAHPVREGTNDNRRCTIPIQTKSAACTRKNIPKIHAAGLMRVKNAAWYTSPDQPQCAARRALIQRLGGRRDDHSRRLTTTDAIHSGMRAGHNASL